MTALAAWQSSNQTVASISNAGLLTIAGAGEADIVATYEKLTGTARVVGVAVRPPVTPTTFEISGVVHESAPFSDIPVAGARIEVVRGALDGGTTTTDAAGRFSLAGFAGPDFALKAKKADYEDAQFDVFMLPRDRHPSISLNPVLRVDRWEGTLAATGPGPFDTKFDGWPDAPVFLDIGHHGPVTITLWAGCQTAGTADAFYSSLQPSTNVQAIYVDAQSSATPSTQIVTRAIPPDRYRLILSGPLGRGRLGCPWFLEVRRPT